MSGTHQSKVTEPSFNVELGNVLRRKHPLWVDCIEVERKRVLADGPWLQPDLVIHHPGALPVIIETEYAPARTVEADARKRLGNTLHTHDRPIEQTIALCIPEGLSRGSQHNLRQSIAAASFEFCILSGSSGDPKRWPESGWVEGGIDALAACIERVAMSEDLIEQGTRVLEDGVAQAAGIMHESTSTSFSSISEVLHQQEGEQTTRMGMAIVANAMTFQMSIAESKSDDGSFKIEVLDNLRGETGRLPKYNVLEHWRNILLKINYWPIFKIASQILQPIPDRLANRILERLSRVVSELVTLGASSQHDLSGQMFQRLITDRKFLATFYTLPASATLLAELALARLATDWSDAQAVRALRIADFACGTGALLNAAYQAVLARCRRRGSDDSKLHAEMMKSALVGTDIMPAATHLTASVLSSAHPKVPFTSTAIITLPYGEQPEDTGRPLALGALDLIEEETTLSLFGTGQQRLLGSARGNEQVNIPHNSFDLVIMNPPFTRPTNHESATVPVPSFAGFSTRNDEQKAMSKKLAQIRRPDMAGHGNAGLASNFMDIAHAKLKPGGVLALVLPASFLQGESWTGARHMLETCYRDITIVSIAATGSRDRAFSADTGMAEVLLVATRNKDSDEADERVLFINLLHRPGSIFEAAAIAGAVCQVPADQTSGSVSVGSSEQLGRYIRGTLAETGKAGLRSSETARAATGLLLGELQLPRLSEFLPVPVCSLGDLGQRGLLGRDISGKGGRGPFDIVPARPDEVPTYPALWNHDARRETRLLVAPDTVAEPRPGSEERALNVWQKTASRLHFSIDFQINSQPLAACMTEELTIGGAWPNFLCSDKRWEVPLLLWAGSTLGLIAFWWIGTRQQQGRARLSISRLPSLTVLDTRTLTAAQLDHAHAIFSDFAGRQLLPANEAYRDETRQALDRALLIDLLQLPEHLLAPLDLLRRQWCAEPSVHGGKSTAPK